MYQIIIYLLVSIIIYVTVQTPWTNILVNLRKVDRNIFSYFLSTMSIHDSK